MELQQLYITCCSVVTGMAGTAATRKRQSEYDYRKNACLLWPLVSIITESVNIYCLLQDLITAKMHQDKDVWTDVRRFYDQHNKLRGIYHSARQVPFLAARVVTLALPAQPPVFDVSAPLDRPDQEAPTDADIALASQLGDDLFARSDASPAMPRRNRQQHKGRGSGDAAGSRLAVPNGGDGASRGSSVTSPLPHEAHELEDLRVKVASLESYISELTGGLTEVDPETVASMVAEMHQAQERRNQIETLKQQLEQAQDEIQELQSARVALETESATREQDLEAQLQEARQNYQSVKSSLQSTEVGRGREGGVGTGWTGLTGLTGLGCRGQSGQCGCVTIMCWQRPHPPHALTFLQSPTSVPRPSMLTYARRLSRQRKSSRTSRRPMLRPWSLLTGSIRPWRATRSSGLPCCRTCSTCRARAKRTRDSPFSHARPVQGCQSPSA